jgi:hypothetical protein
MSSGLKKGKATPLYQPWHTLTRLASQIHLQGGGGSASAPHQAPSTRGDEQDIDIVSENGS